MFKNMEILRTHGETGRNEPNEPWGDLPVGWRETEGL